MHRYLVGTILFIAIFSLFSCTGSMKEFDNKVGYVGYMPPSLDRQKSYPMLFLLSNNGDAASMAKKFKKLADTEQIIVVADKHFKKEVDINSLYTKLDITLNECTRRYPVDSKKIFVAGFDEAATGAYILTEAYPQVINGVIANCGIMTYGAGQYRNISFPKDFPRKKFCVFITGPDDYRYGQMRADMKNLEALEWKCKWIEFNHGHAQADLEHFASAIQWLKEEASKPVVEREETAKPLEKKSK